MRHIVEPPDWTKPGPASRWVSLSWANDAGAGRVELPIHRHVGGAGPRVLVVGGTHGDEFEGQWAASSLIARMGTLAVAGTLTVLPRHNPAACAAGLRCSPVEGADLNRLYDSREAFGPSSAIARFVAAELLPEIDWLIDLHSGGATHEFLLSSNLQAKVGSAEERELRPALEAFGAPYAIIFDDTGSDTMPHRGTLEGAARALGVKCISSELGGAARLTPESVQVAEGGLLNLLAHIGCIAAPGTSGRVEPTCFLRLDHEEHYCRAPTDGLVVPVAALGQGVEQGAVVARLMPDNPFGADAQTIRARRAGIVAAVPTRAQFRAGDMVVAIAEPA